MSDRLRDLVRILGTGGVLMGLFLAGAAGLLLYGQHAATKGWLPTTGEVISGNVYSKQSKRVGHRGTLYGARWLIRFKIADAVLDSTANAGFETRSQEEMQKVVDSRPPGSNVQILYDPNGTGRIALAQGMLAKSSPVLRLLEIATLCFVGGLLLIIVVPRFAQ